MQNLFPYTNTHELNLDWVLQVVKDFQTKYTTFDQALADALEAIETAKTGSLEDLQTALTAALESISGDLASAQAAISADQASALQAVQFALTSALATLTTSEGEAAARINSLYNTLPSSAQDIINRLNILDTIITGNTPESFVWLQGDYIYEEGVTPPTPPAINTESEFYNYRVSSRYMTGVGGRRIRIITDGSIEIAYILNWRNTPPGGEAGAYVPGQEGLTSTFFDILLPMEVTAISVELKKPGTGVAISPSDIPGHIEIQWITDFVSQRVIAPKEESLTANVARETGELFFYEGVLYIALNDIAVGDTIVIDGAGANCRETTVGHELYKEIDDIANLQSDMTTAQGDITSLESDMTTAQGDITSLQGDMTTAQGDITSLESDMTTAQGDITSLQGDMTTAQGDITSLESDMTTAQGDITSLESDMTTAQGDITSLQGDMTTAQGDITSLQGDMTTAQGDITSLESDMTTAQGDILDLQTDFAKTRSATEIIVQTDPASVTSITDGAPGNLKSYDAAIEPVQDLHGYDHPWPGGGGKNKLDPDTMTTYAEGNGRRWYYADGYTLLANQAYTFSVSGTDQLISLYIVNKSDNTNIIVGNTAISYTPTEDTLVYFQAYRGEVILDGNNFQLELGSSASAFEPYSNICPISGWTGIQINRTGTEANSSTDYTITFPAMAGTVYGGNLHVAKDGTGTLTVDKMQIASYSGETLPGEWISDRDVYASGTSPTTGAQVVYDVASPTTYTLTAPQITLLLGANNIRANTGNTAIQYLANTKLYIDSKILNAIANALNS